MESQLAKQARLKKQEDEKKRREKAKKFSKDMNKGKWKLKKTEEATYRYDPEPI